MGLEVRSQVPDCIVQRCDHIDRAGKLPGLQQVVCRTCRKPALHFGRQVSGGVVHRKNVKKNFQAGRRLGGAKHLRLTLMSETLQLIFFVEAHDRPTSLTGPRGKARPFSSNAFIFKRLPKVSVVS